MCTISSMDNHHDLAEDPYPLTSEQIEGVKKAEASMRRGKFASEAWIRDFFGKV